MIRQKCDRTIRRSMVVARTRRRNLALKFAWGTASCGVRPNLGYARDLNFRDNQFLVRFSTELWYGESVAVGRRSMLT